AALASAATTAAAGFEWDRWDFPDGAAGGKPTFSIEDLSRGLESVSIHVCNDEDEAKLPYFRYVTSYVMGGDVQQNMDVDSMVCCDCTDGCRDPSICACLRLRAGKGGSVYQADVSGGGGSLTAGKGSGGGGGMRGAGGGAGSSN
ncbi:unnamed protein product, partial [Scytosiphon promiscuus]